MIPRLFQLFYSMYTTVQDKNCMTPVLSFQDVQVMGEKDVYLSQCNVTKKAYSSLRVGYVFSISYSLLGCRTKKKTQVVTSRLWCLHFF